MIADWMELKLLLFEFYFTTEWNVEPQGKYISCFPQSDYRPVVMVSLERLVLGKLSRQARYRSHP